MEEIAKVSNWNLSELILDGNPVCDSFRDQADYIR